MKIAIIGGGPAGLFFANYLKTHMPSSDITVYEAANSSMNSFGLGYTLQKLDCILLERMDPNFYINLFQGKPTPLITQALFKTNTETRTLPFSDGFSVSRKQLLDYLQASAQSLNVEVVSQKIVVDDLETLKDHHDLVLAADGINSIARKKYQQQLKAHSHTAKLKFSWFTNETKEARSEACFYAFHAKEGVTLLTSYPLNPFKQIVVIEMSDHCIQQGELKGKTPEEAVPYLNSLLNQNGDRFDLKSANLPWYTFRMNTTENLYHENLALIGDAAYSFHYSAGQGVTTSFSMAYTLAQCLIKNSDLGTALAHYNHSLKLLLKEPASKSLSHMRWFEDIDQHFAETPAEHWLDLFLEKDMYARKKAIKNRCSTQTCR